VLSLFLVGLSLVGVLIAAELAILLLFAGSGVAVLGLAAGGFDKVQEFLHRPAPSILASLAPFLGTSLLVSIPLTGCATAIVAAPWARVYKSLLDTDLSETFA